MSGINKLLELEAVSIRAEVVGMPLIDLPGEFNVDGATVVQRGALMLPTYPVIIKLSWSESFGPVLAGTSYMRVTNLLMSGHLKYVMGSATDKDIGMFKMLHGDNLYEDIKWLYEP